MIGNRGEEREGEGDLLLCVPFVFVDVVFLS